MPEHAVIATRDGKIFGIKFYPINRRRDIRKEIMSSKIHKEKKFDVGAAVRANARDRIGTPKSSFIIIPKNERAPRHKKSWDEYIENEFDELAESLEK